MKSKPKITNKTQKTITVKCPTCGQHNTVIGTNRCFMCKRCKSGIDLDFEYTVDKYY